LAWWFIILVVVAMLLLIRPTRVFLFSIVSKLRAFVKEVLDELKKVSWPAKTELRSSTGLVIFSTLILSLFIWLMDLALRLVMALVVR
jgi:preprotein translocase subunit SecE